MSVRSHQYRQSRFETLGRTRERDAGHQFVFSGHALKRAQQRGVRRCTIRLVLDHHDHRFHAGGSLHRIRISRRNAVRLTQHGVSRAAIDRARGIVLVVSLDDRTVITVMHERHKRWHQRSMTKFI